MKIKISASVSLLVLTACGGGGGSSNNPTSTVPSVPVTSTINAADAFKKFITTAQTISGIPAVGSTTGTATLIIGPEQAYPFVTNGAAVAVASSNKIQFQRLNTAGILLRQNLWKFDFDAQMNPVGMASGVEFSKYTECMSVTSKNSLPEATSSSGVFFSGNQTTAYSETFRAGTYAHYCDPTTSYPANVEWAAITDTSIQYFCLVTPSSFTASKTSICLPVDKTGALGTSVWLRVYGTDGALIAEYRKK